MRNAVLPGKIADLILDHVREAGLPAGARLPEQRFAKLFAVSRTPVRAALEVLRAMGVVKTLPNRGYQLNKDAEALDRTTVRSVGQLEDVYLSIAEDRLAGRLPDRISENQLMRRYGLSRGSLTKLLGRMAQEGWAERSLGNGWHFLPTLTSAESFSHAYQFRMAIEPAAILLPHYHIDRTAFRRERERQKALLAGDLVRLSRAELFDINSEFHETLIACSGNPFFLDGLRRINRLRRLIEYRTFVDTDRLAAQCREHLKLLDLIEGGDRPAAAHYLQRHLNGAARRKIAAGLVGERPAGTRL